MDWKKVAKGALIAVVGALSMYVSTVVAPALQEQPGVLASIGAIASILANMVNQYMKTLK